MTLSALGTWNLILSTDPPSWFSVRLQQQLLAEAKVALPNETAGLFVRDGDVVQAWPAVAVTSPDSFTVDPDWLVAAVYRCDDLGAQMIGTYHTHPQATPAFSERDRPLFAWGRIHLLISDTQHQPEWLWGRLA